MFARKQGISLKYREFRNIEGSKNRRQNYIVKPKQIQGKQLLVRRIGSFEILRVRKIGIPLYIYIYI